MLPIFEKYMNLDVLKGSKNVCLQILTATSSDVLFAQSIWSITCQEMILIKKDAANVNRGTANADNGSTEIPPKDTKTIDSQSYNEYIQTNTFKELYANCTKQKLNHKKTEINQLISKMAKKFANCLTTFKVKLSATAIVEIETYYSRSLYDTIEKYMIIPFPL